MLNPTLSNPFKPGAGHMPPHLAGRKEEQKTFNDLLKQKIILKNLILTGLRGVGKTVLLEYLKPIAIHKKWLWVGTDLSESACVNEESMALRLIADLSVITSDIVIEQKIIPRIGLTNNDQNIEIKLNYSMLLNYFASIPGLISDKLKGTLELIWSHLKNQNINGVIFAYDEAQTMSDHEEKGQYPLSVLLDVFQSIQRKDIPFMLVLTGLPTLFPKLVEARTYSERMFTILFLDRLSDYDSREAILVPTKEHPIQFDETSVTLIIQESDGYPYFIQFICKEFYDLVLQRGINVIPISEILRKLDADFFAGRWAKATDRERELLAIAAMLKNNDEFTVKSLVENSKKYLEKGFQQSQVSQMLSKLSDAGLIYKNRYGKYSFAVPLLGKFIERQKILQKV